MAVVLGVGRHGPPLRDSQNQIMRMMREAGERRTSTVVAAGGGGQKCGQFQRDAGGHRRTSADTTYLEVLAGTDVAE